MIRHIVKGVGEQEATIRSRGLKALSGIIGADPACLENVSHYCGMLSVTCFVLISALAASQEHVAKVVSSCLRDKQPSVREAAVDLFDRVLCTQPQKAEHHFLELCSRLQVYV